MTQETQTGTLEELNVKPGDVVEWQWSGERIEVKEWMIGFYDGKYSIVSRATPDTPADDTPKTWEEMTREEKGALLLAEFNGVPLEQKGKVIVGGERLFRWAPKQDGCWLDSFSYRIKPEPVVEEVAIGIANATCGKWYQPGHPGSPATHRITFTTTDGTPDLDSITMERINDQS